ncbi:hypothetical protein FRC08_018570 [Ceratobasidium sp. 394]|nr:hypothetical protein FRC08_018570 [Ceratobasidium sp. 394]
MRLSCTPYLRFPPYTPLCLSQSGGCEVNCLKHPNSVPGVYAQPKPGQWSDQMTLALPRWQQLTNLIVNGHFLGTQDAVRRVSTLPNLVRLLIVTPSSLGWADLPSGDGVFPKLHAVTLDMATHSAAQAIFCCPAVSSRIIALDWSISRHDNSAGVTSCADVLSQISRVASGIHSLHIFDIDGNGARRSLWACKQLYEVLPAFSPSRFYTECDMHIFDKHPSLMYAFISLGSRLTYLSLVRLQVPAQLLELFAHAYPMLSYLRCTVDITALSRKHADKRLSIRTLKEVRNRDSSSITLFINFTRRRRATNVWQPTTVSPKGVAR